MDAGASSASGTCARQRGERQTGDEAEGPTKRATTRSSFHCGVSLLLQHCARRRRIRPGLGVNRVFSESVKGSGGGEVRFLGGRDMGVSSGSEIV